MTKPGRSWRCKQRGPGKAPQGRSPASQLRRSRFFHQEANDQCQSAGNDIRMASGRNLILRGRLWQTTMGWSAHSRRIKSHKRFRALQDESWHCGLLDLLALCIGNHMHGVRQSKMVNHQVHCMDLRMDDAIHATIRDGCRMVVRSIWCKMQCGSDRTGCWLASFADLSVCCVPCLSSQGVEGELPLPKQRILHVIKCAIMHSKAWHFFPAVPCTEN